MRIHTIMSVALATAALSSCFENRTATPAGGSPPLQQQAKPSTNLANAASPFDRSFADTAVWWHSWGDAAFAAAKEYDRPLFLFVGYPSCPWSAKMRQISFNDPEVVDLINSNFIPVLADAEALPGINRVFMRYLEATRQQSGWPLCVWLTPDRLPITAGTYFPETSDGTSPAFLTVLKHVSDQWNKFPDHYRTQARRDLGLLVEQFDSFETPSEWDPSPAFLDEVYTKLASAFDPLNGGFGTTPKFPSPLKLKFLLRYADRFPEAAYQRERALTMVTKTLDQLLASSTHDHLGNGFFRYSQHASWNSPNFEKMLDDQALMAGALIWASTATGNSRYAAAARRTLDFVLENLALPGSAYASAISAESPPDNSPGTRASIGNYYTWTPAEITAALGGNPNQAATAIAFYQVNQRGNIPLGSTPHKNLNQRNTLFFSTSESAPPAELATINAALLQARATRPAPERDELLVLEWNALLASALVAAASHFDEPSYLTTASDLVTFLLENFRSPDSGELVRTLYAGTPGHPACSADYAALVTALLDLHTATPTAGWLDKALSLQATMDRRFYDSENGGFWDIAERNELFYNIKPTVDGTRPSANATAITNLVRLATITGDQSHLDQALATLRSRHTTLNAALDQAPAMTLAVMDYLDAGDPGTP